MKIDELMRTHMNVGLRRFNEATYRAHNKYKDSLKLVRSECAHPVIGEKWSFGGAGELRSRICLVCGSTDTIHPSWLDTSDGFRSRNVISLTNDEYEHARRAFKAPGDRE